MKNYIQQTLNQLEQEISGLEYFCLIRTGKEAEVHLVDSSIGMLALKIYKENLKYSTRNDYIPTHTIQDKRLQRAVRKRTKTGRNKMQNIWTEREFSTMEKLESYLSNIPKVYARTENSILMEFIGENNTPAPRLSDISLDYQFSLKTFKSIVDSIKVFIELGFVHGDLSEYNILWFNSQPFIIDFPQVLDIRNNKNANDKFFKDLDNIEKYFEKELGGEMDRDIKELEELFAIRYWM